jgi:hypothetical protein
MTAHVELTEQERVEAARFWGNYFRSGGKNETPSAFQLDAINDTELRDRVMMWQIGADASAYNPEMGEKFATEYRDVMEALGANPDADSAQDAIVSVIGDFNDQPVDADDLDTGAVFVLMHCMWALLGGRFDIANTMLRALELLAQRSRILGVTEVPFENPLAGLRQAATLFMMLQSVGANRETLLKESALMFGLAEDHPNVVSARSELINTKRGNE